MRIPGILSALLLGSAPAAAQCEIDWPASQPAITNLVSEDFADGLIALAGDAKRLTLFEPGATGWAQSFTVNVPGTATLFGPRVVTDGERVLVGMPSTGPSTNYEGRVYVFERSQGWQAPLELGALAPESFDTFGNALAIAGDTALIAASGTVIGGQVGIGKSFLFEFDGVDWGQTAVFQPPGPSGYGEALDTDGTTAVVGASSDGQMLSGAGAVHVYQRGPAGWTEAAKLFSDPPRLNGRFGTSLAVEGDTLVVGAPPIGTVFVFERRPDGWAQVQRLTPTTGQVTDEFGASLALAGDRLVVGAPRFEGAGGVQAQGAIYVFERAAGLWTQARTVLGGDGPAQAFSGRRVHVLGNQVLWATSFPATPPRLASLGIDAGTTFCNSTPNSSGNSATIAPEGCDSVFAGALGLNLAGAPPGELGLFLFSSARDQQPFGNGALCLGPAVQRLAGGTIDAGGTLSVDIDFSQGAGSLLTSGERWHFQAVFRDAGVGAELGSSDAVSLQLQP